MVAIWNPRHTPRNGTLFSLAYLAAASMPSTPLVPKPPGTIMPSTTERTSAGSSDVSLSLSTKTVLTLHLLAAPAWVKASRWDR